MTKINFQFFLPLALAACTGAPNTVEVSLAPSLISSLDGRTTVSAIVAEDATPIADTAVQLTVDYTDRNGTPHVIAPIDGRTNERGVFATTLEGLQWDGVGKVTVTVDGLASEADFAVLDRTPPKATLLSPTTDNHVGPGLPIDVQVHVTDEIGVGQVILDVTGNVQGQGNGFGRSTTLVSGTLDGTVTFRINVPQGAQAGDTLVLYALATDLSGNSAAAMALTLTVDPTITIATPPGLVGALLVDGTATSLNDPRSIASSPKDGKLYVADVAGGACNSHCIWQIDPATGTVNPTPAFAGLANVVGLGVIEGIAFDASGDNLYFTDRQNRTGRLTFNGTAYASPVLCNDPQTQRPQDPIHIVFDPTLGLLTPDSNGRELVQILTCAPGTAGVELTNHNFDRPHGIALGPTGEIYVSDQAANELVRVDRGTGAVTGFDAQIEAPRGIEWFAGGTTPFADSLMVASSRGGGGGGGGVIESTKGLGTKLAAAFLRNTPTDLAFIGGTMFVLTAPSANNRGRLYKVTGF